MSAIDIQERMEDSGCKLVVLVLDCCRESKGMRSSKRAESMGGLGEMKVSSTSQTYIALACAPNKTSADGNGDNGNFTAAVLNHIDAVDEDGNGIDIDYIFSRVRLEVKNTTKGEQLPFSHHSLQEPRPARLIDAPTAHTPAAKSSTRALTLKYAKTTDENICNAAEEPKDPVVDMIYELAGHCRCLFSFGSRGGGAGLHLAMRLQEELNHRLGWSREAYIDAVNLREHKNTEVVTQVPQEWETPQDLPPFDMVLNDNWAQFYYMAMLACSVVVVVLDRPWKESPWTQGEWELFNKSALATFQQPGEEDEATSYTFKLIVVFDSNEFSENEATKQLVAWGFPERLQDSKTMIGMPCSSAMRSTLEDEEGWKTADLEPEALSTFLDAVDGAVVDPEYNPEYGSSDVDIERV